MNAEETSENIICKKCIKLYIQKNFRLLSSHLPTNHPYHCAQAV